MDIRRTNNDASTLENITLICLYHHCNTTVKPWRYHCITNVKELWHYCKTTMTTQMWHYCDTAVTRRSARGPGAITSGTSPWLSSSGAPTITVVTFLLNFSHFCPAIGACSPLIMARIWRGVSSLWHGTQQCNASVASLHSLASHTISCGTLAAFLNVLIQLL